MAREVSNKSHTVQNRGVAGRSVLYLLAVLLGGACIVAQLSHYMHSLDHTLPHGQTHRVQGVNRTHFQYDHLLSPQDQVRFLCFTFLMIHHSIMLLHMIQPILSNTNGLTVISTCKPFHLSEIHAGLWHSPVPCTIKQQAQDQLEVYLKYVVQRHVYNLSTSSWGR